MAADPQLEQNHPEFIRARYFAGRCRPRKAHKACVSALLADPQNAHAIALKARLEVQLQELSSDEAQVVVRDLIHENPGDAYLEVSLAALVAQGGDRPAAVLQLRATAEAHQDDPYVHQALAGLLGCDRATWDEALDHYEIALRSGPLLTPGYKSAAYYLARRKDPSLAKRALQGTTPVEGAALRSRALGFNRMSLILALLWVLSLALDALGHDGWGVGVMVITSAWAAWVAFTNYAVGCWKCTGVWVGIFLAVWGSTIWATSLHTRSLIWSGVGGLGIVTIVDTIKNLWVTPRTTEKSQDVHSDSRRR